MQHSDRERSSQLHKTHFGQYQVDVGGAPCQIRGEQACTVSCKRVSLLHRSSLHKQRVTSTCITGIRTTKNAPPTSILHCACSRKEQSISS